MLIYLYDANGSPIGMQYRTSSDPVGEFDTFWFEKNLQGDIIAVYNDAGTLLATYAYDAWGGIADMHYYNSGASTGAAYNPFRYRGYYFDTETGFYYLNSRYYDPNTGRFINADVYVDTNTGILSNNMYAYCNNSPIGNYDPLGEWTFSLNLTLDLGLICGYSGSIGFSVDSEGMIAIQCSYSVPKDSRTRNTVFGMSGGAGVSMQFTNLDSVSDLEGNSTYVGISMKAMGGNLVMDSYTQEIVGIEGNFGYSFGSDIHVNKTYTKTLIKFRSPIKFIRDKLGW